MVSLLCEGGLMSWTWVLDHAGWFTGGTLHLGLLPLIVSHTGLLRFLFSFGFSPGFVSLCFSTALGLVGWVFVILSPWFG